MKTQPTPDAAPTPRPKAFAALMETIRWAVLIGVVFTVPGLLRWGALVVLAYEAGRMVLALLYLVLLARRARKRREREAAAMALAVVATALGAAATARAQSTRSEDWRLRA